MNSKLAGAIALLIIAVSVKANAESSSLVDCLNALNTKNVVTKGKIHILSADGTSFAVAPPSGKPIAIYTSYGTFTLSANGSPKCALNSELIDAPHGIVEMLTPSNVPGLEFGVEAKAVLSICLKNSAIAQLWKAPGRATSGASQNNSAQ